MFAAADAEDAQAEPDYQQMLAKALGANTWESDGEVHEALGQPSSSSQNPHIANSDPYGACDSMDDADDDEVEDESSDGAPEKNQTRVTLCTAVDVPLRTLVYRRSSTEVHREAEVAPINVVSCTSGSVGCLDAKDSARVKGEAGHSKKTQWKQARFAFRFARCRKKGGSKRSGGKGVLEKVPGTPEKRNMASVFETPEKQKRGDEVLVGWLKEAVGASCFGQTKKAFRFLKMCFSHGANERET